MLRQMSGLRALAPQLRGGKVVYLCSIYSSTHSNLESVLFVPEKKKLLIIEFLFQYCKMKQKYFFCHFQIYQEHSTKLNTSSFLRHSFPLEYLKQNALHNPPCIQGHPFTLLFQIQLLPQNISKAGILFSIFSSPLLVLTLLYIYFYDLRCIL